MEIYRERWLDGQSAIVTGGSRGIGAGVALELAARGAAVVINYRSKEEQADGITEEILAAGGRAIAVQADVSDERSVANLVGKALEEFGHLDIMVTNAGIQKDERFIDMSLSDWQKVISVNMTGQFLCAQAAARVFCRQGVREGVSRAAGKIVSMSSVHEVIPWAGHVNYAAAKGGVQMMMRSMAQELAASRIRVNGVAPGAIRTDINRDVWSNESEKAHLLTLIPYGCLGEPEDVARAVSWLCSDHANYVTGATLFVDGGMTLYPGFVEGG